MVCKVVIDATEYLVKLGTLPKQSPRFDALVMGSEMVACSPSGRMAVVLVSGFCARCVAHNDYVALVKASSSKLELVRRRAVLAHAAKVLSRPQLRRPQVWARQPAEAAEAGRLLWADGVGLARVDPRAAPQVMGLVKVLEAARLLLLSPRAVRASGGDPLKTKRAVRAVAALALAARKTVPSLAFNVLCASQSCKLNVLCASRSCGLDRKARVAEVARAASSLRALRLLGGLGASRLRSARANYLVFNKRLANISLSASRRALRDVAAPDGALNLALRHQLRSLKLMPMLASAGSLLECHNMAAVGMWWACYVLSSYKLKLCQAAMATARIALEALICFRLQLKRSLA